MFVTIATMQLYTIPKPSEMRVRLSRKIGLEPLDPNRLNDEMEISRYNSL